MTAKTAFSTSHEYVVEVRHEELGAVGQGTLVFGEAAGSHVSFGMLSLSGVLKEDVTYPRLVAKAVSGEVFSLFGCVLNTFRIYVDFVVDSDVYDAFQRIHVRLSDVSEWFFAGQYLSGEVGESLTWERTPGPIQVEIQSDAGPLSIGTSVVGTRTRSGENIVINEYVCFFVENDNPTKRKGISLNFLDE